MKPYPNEELERMSKREIIRLYKRTVEQFNDAVPVVRCKDCKWGRESCGNIECHVDLNIPSEYHGYDWYCPNGERKEECSR